MKLIYVWIEEFRNIYQQGFCIDRKYNICLEKDICENTRYEFYRISISKNTEYFNLMEYKNIENLTVIVGKNGAAKPRGYLLYLNCTPHMILLNFYIFRLTKTKINSTTSVIMLML